MTLSAFFNLDPATVKNIQWLAFNWTCLNLTYGAFFELWSVGDELVVPLFLGISSVAFSLLWSILPSDMLCHPCFSSVFACPADFSLDLVFISSVTHLMLISHLSCPIIMLWDFLFTSLPTPL